eukprot:Nk52_evm1s591 gene=Nk52_evmTU1s591
MLLTSLGVCFLVIGAILAFGGAWMTQVYLFTAGFLVVGAPAYVENVLIVLNEYVSSTVFAPTNSYESFLVAGAIGGFVVTKDAFVTQRFVVSVCGGYLTALLVFSFGNYSTTQQGGQSMASASSPVSGLGQSPLGILNWAEWVKYLVLGLSVGIYISIIIILRYFKSSSLSSEGWAAWINYIAMVCLTAVMAGYAALLAAEFLNWFGDGQYMFVDFTNSIEVFLDPSAGSVCVFQDPQLVLGDSSGDVWTDACFIRHFIWVCIAAGSVLIQLLSTVFLIRELPYAIRGEPELPKAVTKSPFTYKDMSGKIFASTNKSEVDNVPSVVVAEESKGKEHSSAKKFSHWTEDPMFYMKGFADSIIDMNYLRTTSYAHDTHDTYKSEASSSISSVDASSNSSISSTCSSQLSASSSYYESYINLSYIADPVLGTVTMTLMFIMTAIVSLSILLSVDWIFSSTIVGVVFVICFVIVFRAVIDAFFQTILHYVFYFLPSSSDTPCQPSASSASSEQQLEPFSLSPGMKCIGAYCLLSNHEESSADCFKTMYGTFARNIDLDGNYDTACVSVTNDVDIVRIELQLRDMYRAQLSRDMYKALERAIGQVREVDEPEVDVVMAAVQSKSGAVGISSLQNSDVSSISEFSSSSSSADCDSSSSQKWGESVSEKLHLPEWDAIVARNIAMIDTHFLAHEEGASEEMRKWLGDLEQAIPYERLVRVWKQFIYRWVEEYVGENREGNSKSFAESALEFIEMKCERFMYFHRNSRVLRKPGQYQDIIQLATWGIDYSYAYSADLYPKGNPRGQTTFGFIGNLKNNSKYTDDEFEQIREMLQDNTRADFERVKRAGLSHAKNKGHLQRPVCDEELEPVIQRSMAATQYDENDWPYAFTLLMDADTNAPEAAVQKLVQIGYSNPLNGIIQPLIDAGNSYTTEETRRERNKSDTLHEVLMANYNRTTLPASSSDSTVVVDVEEEADTDVSNEVAEGMWTPDMPSPYMKKGAVTVFPHTVFMWRTKLKQMCVPTVGASLSRVFGRSYFYGKGLINNLAYCSLLIGTPDKPRNILPLDIYSHDTYESLLCRPCVTDKVIFTEEAMGNPLALHSQQCRWMIGELINGCYLYPQTVGMTVRRIRWVLNKWFSFKEGVLGVKKVNRFPFVLRSEEGEDQDICNMGSFIAAYFAKEPIRILTAPFFIVVTLLLQTFCTSTVRPVPSIADIYNEEQLFSVVITQNPPEVKYWFFIYFKNFQFPTGLLIFMFTVWVGVPVVFKAFDILFRLNYCLHKDEPSLTIWRRRGIHLLLTVFETLLSVVSYPPEILMGAFRVVKAFWALAIGELNWRPQREVELEMDAVSAAGSWPLMKVCLRQGGAAVTSMGIFLLFWLIYLQPTFVNSSNVLIVPAFVVWMGAFSWIIHPLWSFMLASEMSPSNRLFVWLLELELVLNRVAVLDEKEEDEDATN